MRGLSAQKGKDLDWLKEKCRELVRRDKIVEFLANVAKGEPVEQAVGSEGEVISIPASVRDRIKATELLLDRGFGKASQPMELSGQDGSPFAALSDEQFGRFLEVASRNPNTANRSGTGEKA